MKNGNGGWRVENVIAGKKVRTCKEENITEGRNSKGREFGKLRRRGRKG